MPTNSRHRPVSWSFMWPKIRCISVPTSENEITSVIKSSHWIRIIWAETQKMLAIGPLYLDFGSSCTVSLKVNLQPWEDCWVWKLCLPFVVIIYRPQWVYEANKVFADNMVLYEEC